MKNLLLPALTVLLTVFTACRKDHICECDISVTTTSTTTNANGSTSGITAQSDTTVTRTYYDSKKSELKTVCGNSSYTSDLEGSEEIDINASIKKSTEKKTTCKI